MGCREAADPRQLLNAAWAHEPLPAFPAPPLGGMLPWLIANHLARGSAFPSILRINNALCSLAYYLQHTSRFARTFIAGEVLGYFQHSVPISSGAKELALSSPSIHATQTGAESKPQPEIRTRPASSVTLESSVVPSILSTTNVLAL